MKRSQSRQGVSRAHVTPWAALLACLSVAHVATGQCVREWLPGDQVRGTLGEAGLLAPWDPDGPGPAQPVLAMAGRLLHAGDTPSWIVTTWDGTRFAPLTTGPVGTSSACNPGSLCFVSDINALTVYQGDLVIAGLFTIGDSANAEFNVARWIGTQWQALGTGLSPNAERGLPFTVLSLGVWQNSLVAACSDASYILTDGVWTQLGPRRFDVVRDFEVFGGELFRAGDLPGSFVSQEAVERWNGSAWEGLWDNEATGSGYDLFTFNNQLHVVALNVSGQIFTSGVYRWLGGRNWQLIAAPVSGIAEKAVVYAGEIYLIGQIFGDTTGVLARGVLRLDSATQTWQSIGPALPGTSTPGIEGVVNDIAVYDDKVFVVGGFSRAGETPAANVVAWDGTAWNSTPATGGTGPVLGVAAAGGSLFAAGRFSALGGATARNIAVNDGAGWRQAGDGFTGFISDLSSFGQSAAFTTSNGLNVRVLALQNGVWTQLGADLPNPSGFIPVGYVTELSDGLYASTLSSSTPVYRWDGESWITPGFATTQFASVYDVTRFNGLLVVGGNSLVEPLGTVFGSCVGFFNDQQQLVPFGVTEDGAPLLRGIVRAVEVYNGELYAAGTELRFLDSLNFIGDIARWTGSTWVPVGGGLARDGGNPAIVADLQVFDGELVATGAIDLAGGQPVRNIAAWNGTTWRGLGTGVGQQRAPVQPIIESVSAMTVSGDTLVVGGLFATAGGVPSAFIATWGCGSAGCDTIDFNRNDVFPEEQDIIDFFGVLSGAPCPYVEPCDIDFNNNDVFPEDQDVIDFFSVLAGGPCST